MKEEKTFADSLRATAPYLTLGAQLAITVVVFFYVGKYVDDFLETTPWMMVTMTLLGAVGGLIKFFKTVIELSKKEDDERRNEQ